VARVRALGDYRVEEFRLVEERVMFPLPGELLASAKAKGVAFAAGNERAAARASAEPGAAQASVETGAAGAAARAAKAGSGTEPARAEESSAAEFRIRHH
jgi:hypothetical protein